jgi:hypothetical protein
MYWSVFMNQPQLDMTHSHPRTLSPVFCIMFVHLQFSAHSRLLKRQFIPQHHLSMKLGKIGKYLTIYSLLIMCRQRDYHNSAIKTILTKQFSSTGGMNSSNGHDGISVILSIYFTSINICV